MFDTIILLAGPAEQGPLGLVLREHNPGLTIRPIGTKEDFAALDQACLGRARLIAFSTPIIVPRAILRSLGYGAYNFHPGPPQYPGWAPSHFALYEQATEFGATAHLMAARVDSGPIVDVASFAIPPGTGVLALEGMTYARLAQLFWTLAKPRAMERQEKFAPRLCGDLRHPPRYRQGRVRAADAGVRRQSFRRGAHNPPSRRGVPRRGLKDAHPLLSDADARDRFEGHPLGQELHVLGSTTADEPRKFFGGEGQCLDDGGPSNGRTENPSEPELQSSHGKDSRHRQLNAVRGQTFLG